MPERRLLTGNHAAAYGAMLARAEVISAYPITPQTMIVELLSELTASGRMDAKFITVESEHSAMAAVIGASANVAMVLQVGPVLFGFAAVTAVPALIWLFVLVNQDDWQDESH